MSMPEYYFDTETTGLNPEHDKIITIQTQRIDGVTGEPIGEIQILKEWESSEQEILSKSLPCITCKPFDFIFVGNNLMFDFNFLSKRLRHHRLGEIDLGFAQERAFLDLKHILVMINKGMFKGYDEVLYKPGEFAEVDVPRLYEQKRYQDIIGYIGEETRVFLKGYQVLKREMPLLAKHF